ILVALEADLCAPAAAADPLRNCPIQVDYSARIPQWRDHARNCMYRILGADGKEYGPVSADVLRQWIAQGRANNQTRARAEGATEWKLLSELPEFAAELAAKSAATTAPSAMIGPAAAEAPGAEI